MTPGRFQFLPFPCDLNHLRQVVQVCLDFLFSEGLNPMECDAWEHILMESMANAVMHTPITREILTPSILVLVGKDEVEVQVVDYSDGFDLPELMELPDEMAISGRGLYIIRSLSNEVRYFRGRDENRLVVRRMRDRLRLLPSPDRMVGGLLAAPDGCGDAAAQRVTDQELLAARRIQQALLPRSIPAFHQVSIHGECLSAREVGGDFFDVIPWGSHGVLLVIADVMGKGMPAALLAGMLRSHIHAMEEWAIRPGDLLARVNQRLFSDLEQVEMFITVQLVFLDFRTGQGKVASAGHGPLYLFDAGGKLERLEMEGMPLGINAEQSYAHVEFHMPRNGGFLLLTDGVMEMRNPSGESFGLTGLERSLQDSIRCLGSPDQVLGAMIESMTLFRGDEVVRDDQTLLMCLSRRVSP